MSSVIIINEYAAEYSGLSIPYRKFNNKKKKTKNTWTPQNNQSLMKFIYSISLRFFNLVITTLIFATITIINRIINSKLWLISVNVIRKKKCIVYYTVITVYHSCLQKRQESVLACSAGSVAFAAV